MNRYYAIVDGAALPQLQHTALCSQTRIYCLLQGEHSSLTRQRAPHLVPLSRHGDTMTRWVLQHMGEKPVGICCESQLGRHMLLARLRQLLTVRTPQGGGVFFRYFDPEVFSLLIPVFEPDQLQEMFTPVQAWYVPDHHQRQQRRYYLRRGELVVEQQPWASSGMLPWFDKEAPLP